MSCGCGCPGSLGAMCGPAVVAAPTVSRQLEGMGLIGVWPSDVKALKDRLDPSFRATNAAALACASRLPSGMASNWAAFFAAWRGYVAEDGGSGPIFGGGAAYDRGLDYQRQHDGWRGLLRSAGCGIDAPDLPAEREDPVAAGITALKWLGGAAIAVAVVYGIRTVVK